MKTLEKKLPEINEDEANKEKVGEQPANNIDRALNEISQLGRRLGPEDSENIRVTNRSIVQAKLGLAELVLLEEQYRNQANEASDKIQEVKSSISKKVQELNGMVTNAASKLNINLQEGWKLDIERMVFFK